MRFTDHDIVAATAFRRELHRFPEMSNEEARTAGRVVAFLRETGPDAILTGLGGHGVAAVYGGQAPGPTLLFRAELDALPIEELSGVEHASTILGTSHMCGHDGHMAILGLLALVLGRERPKRGRVVLMFQPAEETGDGAANVTADPRYLDIRPDFAFSLHNLPGVPLGHVRLKEGVVNCASRGLRIELGGKTAHSSMPETGVSPMLAVSELMPKLQRLGGGTFAEDDFAMATVTHCRMGEAVFGVAPGHAEIRMTLRTRLDGRMAELCAGAERLLEDTARAHGLGLSFDYHEIFPASLNAPEAVAALRSALDAEAVPHDERDLPMRASEDFGRFGYDSKSAMFFLGAGETHPQLHNPDYDFPDDLIAIGARVFLRVASDNLG